MKYESIGDNLQMEKIHNAPFLNKDDEYQGSDCQHPANRMNIAWFCSGHPWDSL